MKISLIVLSITLIAAATTVKEASDPSYTDNDQSFVGQDEVAGTDKELIGLNSPLPASHLLHQRCSSNKSVASESSEFQDQRLSKDAVKADLHLIENFTDYVNLSALVIVAIIFLFLDY
jgi:hypothetical protein